MIDAGLIDPADYAAEIVTLESKLLPVYLRLNTRFRTKALQFRRAAHVLSRKNPSAAGRPAMLRPASEVPSPEVRLRRLNPVGYKISPNLAAEFIDLMLDRNNANLESQPHPRQKMEKAA